MITIHGSAGAPRWRRLLPVCGVVAAVGLTAAAVTGAGVDENQSGTVATLTPLVITTPSAGPPPITLDDLAEAARTDTSPPGGPVDHLIIDEWYLNSAADGGTVTSTGSSVHRELWHAPDGRTRLDTTTTENNANTPTTSTTHPTYPGDFQGRPPTDPDLLAAWLARASTKDTAILDGVTDLLKTRVLTGAERAAVLTVLDERTGLAYAGTSTDRAGRPGAVVFALPSTSSGGNATHLLLIDPANGRFRGTEEVLTAGAPALNVRYPAVLTSSTYVQADTVAAIP